MNSHDDEPTIEAEIDTGNAAHADAGDDATLAAGSDVVAQIREHAARIRRGEVSATEGVQVWSGEPEPVEHEEAESQGFAAELIDVREPGTLLPEDKTVPMATSRAELAGAIAEARATPAPVTPAPVTPATQPTGSSLIQGQSPPQASTSFWTTDQPFRASGIDAPSRLGSRSRIPLGVWIALVLIVIVLASVGLAVAIASTGPVT